MATISVEPMTALGSMPRVTVNGYQFIEATVMSGTGNLSDVKIETGIGTGAVVVDSWSPEAGSENVDHMQSFVVNCHANPGIAEKDILLDAGTEFEAAGTLVDVVPITNGIQLANDSPSTGFEDYTTGLTVQNAAQPEDWFKTDVKGWQFYVYDNANNWDGKHLETTVGDGRIQVMYTEAGTMESGEVRLQFQDRSTGNQATDVHLLVNVTGSNTAMRGHMLDWASEYIQLRRVTSSTSDTYITGTASPKPGYKGNYIWNLACRFVANGSGTTTYYVKYWKITDSEPASWTWIGSDTVYVSAGWVGMGHQSGYYGGIASWDNFQVSPIPPVYHASGDWTSDPFDMTDIVNYSYAILEWDETTPIDTTALVKARWKNDGTWLTCTNGAEIPGIDLGEDTTAGSSKDSLEFKIELATTDTGETPVIENLHFYHVPLAREGLEIEIGGVISCVEADGSLDVWGIRQIIGGVNDEAWDDVWLQTYQRYHLFGLGENIVAKLIYNGVDIDEIVVEVSPDYWAESNPLAMAEFSMNPIKYASAPVEARWVLLPRWAPMNHVYEWILIDRTLAIHADAYFLVGHVQIDDHAGSLLIAHREVKDFAGSLLVNGFKLNDFRGELLVQGYKRDDHAGMVMPAIKVLEDYAGQIIVAQEVVRDFSGMILVYGVNRDGSIFLNIVDDATYDKLVAEGIVFS